jgi:hypothetical protein
MQYPDPPSSDETVVDVINCKISKDRLEFTLTVTSEAVYIPDQKFVIAGDPWYMRRILLTDVKEVRIERTRPYGVYLLSALLIATSLVFFWSWIAAGAAVAPRTFGWMLAFLVGGLLLPWTAHGRHRLSLVTAPKTFRWLPPLVLDGKSKRQIAATMDRVVVAARVVGVRISDARVADADVLAGTTGH